MVVVSMLSVVSVVSVLSVVSSVVSEEGWDVVNVSLHVWLGILHVLVNDCEDSPWSHTWMVDLQEWVVVSSSLLTGRAEVEVLADTALVSWTSNWELVASIASDIGVGNHLSVVSERRDLVLALVGWLSNLLDVEEIVENVLTLLVKLLLDESLEGLSWKSGVFVELLFSVASVLLMAFAFLVRSDLILL
jgi:hypothetical protein